MSTEIYEGAGLIINAFAAGTSKGYAKLTLMVEIAIIDGTDFVDITPEDMDEICKRWQQYRDS